MHSYSSTPYTTSSPGLHPTSTPDASQESAPFIGGFATPASASRTGTPFKPVSSADYYAEPGGTPEMQQLNRGSMQYLPDRPRRYDHKPLPYTPPRRRSRLFWWLVALVCLAIVVLAVVLPVYFTVIKPHQNTSGSASSAGSGGSTGGSGGSGGSAQPAPAFTGAITGGDGSTLTFDDGSTMTYSNPFGGTWYFDPSDPFNDGARAQSWSPALNETWRFGMDTVRGVNLGGWLVPEPFIVPALFEQYQNGSCAPPYNAQDEWTLVNCMNQNGNATALMEQHYATFITEEDFARIAGAGLNWVRIPVPFWMIEVYPSEPFVPHVSWTYFLKAIQWARKYGLRINMDLHTIPGSQNGWNHSGKLGPINFLFGVMGIANAQRTLSYLRTLTEFVSQPQYKNVVQVFGIVNEAWMPVIGQPELEAFYLEAHNTMRNITGFGEGNGPFITIHDGFAGMQAWYGWLTGSDRIGLDTHPYFAFNAPASVAPPSSFVSSPCSGWGQELNASMQQFGFSMAGEWSVAINDCGLWVNGVGLGNRVEGSYPGSTAVGSCNVSNAWEAWDDDYKNGLKDLALSSMDALQNWFYWTWKIGNSSISGRVESPYWSYSLGLDNGWIPTDPRDAVGFCAGSAGVAMNNPFDGTLSAWQTGGAGAGTIDAAQLASYTWPLTSMNNCSTSPYLAPSDVVRLPQYTETGAIITLAGPTFTTPSSTQTADAGSGWDNPADTAGYYEPIQGCDYPDQWVAVGVPIPTGACGQLSARKRDVPLAARGPAPAPTEPPRF
ncbi:glycoside hydrolase family 5 protein [Calocera cornea HHB12733]|uniref:glucan 1,3-beta-glucosidase n=1 Tax=Calocera cornea HHB12733 TaxID=1353952 RepID=A0A165FWL3_9BASI|nr:glycoside hydrolase family 5 protein [Calocera cornea HHB12733]